MWRRMRPASSRTSLSAAVIATASRGPGEREERVVERGLASDASSTSRRRLQQASIALEIVRPPGAGTERRRARVDLGLGRSSRRAAASSAPSAERDVHAPAADAAP